MESFSKLLPPNYHYFCLLFENEDLSSIFYIGFYNVIMIFGAAAILNKSLTP